MRNKYCVAIYSAVLGRPPFVGVAAMGARNITAYGFPGLERSFWRGLMSVLHDTPVYLTAGLSDHPMTGSPEVAQVYPPRIELAAITAGQILGGPDGKLDIVSELLLGIAEQVIDQGMHIGVGHTLDFDERLSSNTEMSGFVFGALDESDEKRLRAATHAQQILTVIPVTARELTLARADGIEALIERFEAAGVPPVFDHARKGVV